MSRPNQHCECPHRAYVEPHRLHEYHPTLERPFVNHEPHECKCTNDLQEYIRGGRKVMLCSCCC